MVLPVRLNRKPRRVLWAATLSVLLHLVLIGILGSGQRPPVAPSPAVRVSRPMVWVTVAPLPSVSAGAIAPNPSAPAGLAARNATQPQGSKSASRRVEQKASVAAPASVVASPALPSPTDAVASSPSATPTARLKLDLNQAVKDSIARTAGAAPIVQSGSAQSAPTEIEKVFDNALGPANRPLKETRNPDGSGLIQLAKGGCITVPNPNLSRRPPGALLVVTNCPR